MKQLLGFLGFLLFAICSMAQLPSELCLKWASHTAGPVSADLIDVSFPASDTLLLDGKMEIVQRDEAGNPFALFRYAYSSQGKTPIQKMKWEFNRFGYLSLLEIFDWENDGWQPSTKISRSFDAFGQEESYRFEIFEDANWHLLEHFQKPPAAIAAEGRL